MRKKDFVISWVAEKENGADPEINLDSRGDICMICYDFEKVLRETSLSRIVSEAYKARIVIPAFNIPYLPMVQPVVSALKDSASFGLVEVACPDVEKFDAKSFSAVQKEFIRHADRAYTRLHQDHVPAIDEDGKFVDWEGIISEALDLCFDSVMIDGSRLAFDENVEVTRKVVEMAHSRGIPVEGELGAVFGHEKENPPPYEELFRSGRGFTDPEEAREFVKRTGVDWLSVAIGNIHGAISGVAKNRKKINARLNIRHLRKIVSMTNVPIVLHGGSGTKKESIRAGIKNGVTKINIGTAIRQKYERGLRSKDVTFAQRLVREEVKDLIENYFEIRGRALELASLLLDTSKLQSQQGS